MTFPGWNTDFGLRDAEYPHPLHARNIVVFAPVGGSGL